MADGFVSKDQVVGIGFDATCSLVLVGQVGLFIWVKLLMFNLMLFLVLSQSSFLNVTAVMTRGTKLDEGAHLIGGDRAFVASQANHAGVMIAGVKTQYPGGNKHGRLVSVLICSSLFTLTQSLL